MKQGLTEIVFILDRSGSMAGLEHYTIGGYNAMLEKQKSQPGEVLVTTVLFDDDYELLHDRICLKDVTPITNKEYFVRGTTALLDAIGKTIVNIKNAQRSATPDQRAERVMFVITTDGMENASREFTLEKIRQMVEYQKCEFGWEFIFLGANIDAISVAQRFGIDQDRAANYNADSDGTLLNFEVISDAVTQFRYEASLDKDWKARIDEDFIQRGKKQ